MEKRGRVLNILRWGLALATVALAGAMIALCLCIFAEDGVLSPEAIAEKYAGLRYGVWAWAALLVAAKGLEWSVGAQSRPTQVRGISRVAKTDPLRGISRSAKTDPLRGTSRGAKPATVPTPPWVGCALLVGAAALILLGVFNGGLHGAFVKAAAICMECVGLG